MDADATAGKGRGSVSLPWLTALLVALAGFLWWSAGPAPEALVFDRSAIAGGELWRLITGHLVHGDAGHALWDIGALAAIGMMMEPQGRWRMAGALIAGIAAVNVCLWWFMPGLEYYCGLSGVLNALFVVALADLWKMYRHPVFLFGGLGLGAKLAVEITLSQSLFVSTTWPAVPLAHLAGCIGGLALLAVAMQCNCQCDLRHAKQ